MSLDSFKPRSVLVTGANRSLGLEWVRQLQALPRPPTEIYAMYQPEEDAKELFDMAASSKGGLHLFDDDLMDFDLLECTYEALLGCLEGVGLTLVIHCAEVQYDSDLNNVTPEEMTKAFEVNAVAPLMLTQRMSVPVYCLFVAWVQHMLPLLRLAASLSPVKRLSCSKAAIVNVTSALGPLADSTSGGRYADRASKAALNVTSRSLAVELERDGILVLMLHPGWVQTDMGGPNVLITPQSSVEGMMQVLAGADSQLNGAFIDFQGKHIPW